MPFRTMLENNRRWASERVTQDSQYFTRLAREHKPHTLFIGCSDARVPAESILQVEPGELFVHRNIANQAQPTDNNLNAAIQYAVEALGVAEIVVCGHEGCGGVRAALMNEAPSLVDTWVAGVRTTMRLHDDELAVISDVEKRLTRLVELNVMEQVFQIGRSPIVQQAWAKGQTLRVHGWVYGLHTGLVRDLHVMIDHVQAHPPAPLLTMAAQTEQRLVDERHAERQRHAG